MITIWVDRDTVGKASARSTIVKRTYNMPLDLAYPKYKTINMKCEHFCEPQSSNMVHQLSIGVPFVYNLCFGHSIYFWKDLVEDNFFQKGLHYDFRYGVP